MSKNKKGFSRKNRTSEVKRHTFSHEKVVATAGPVGSKRESSTQTVVDNFTYIKKDLMLFLIVAGVILMTVVALYFVTLSVNFKIFGLSV